MAAGGGYFLGLRMSVRLGQCYTAAISDLADIHCKSWEPHQNV